MIIIRQKLYSLGFTKAIASFNKNILGKNSIQSAKSAITTQSKVLTPISKPITEINSTMKKVKDISYNPGKALNNTIADTIRNPAKSVTNLVVDQGIGAGLGSLTGGATNFLPIIPGSSKIGNSLGGKIQKVIDGGKRSPALGRAVKADKFLKSSTANKIEYGVNNMAMKAGNLGSIMSSIF